MGKTNIQWCDWTFNPWIGCREVAPECTRCYAKTLDRNRFSKTLGSGTKENPVSHWGSGPRHRTAESTWKHPLAWNSKAAKEGTRPRVFCLSLGDWLDDENVPIEWLADLLKLIHDTPNLDWLLLTKRPQNWGKRLDYIPAMLALAGFSEAAHMVDDWLEGTGPANVWIGVSAGADQEAALAIPARVHFLSGEPMLHAVDLSLWLGDNPARLENRARSTSQKWVILGGESGSKARPCDVNWIRDAVRRCKRAGVPVFVKQLGSKPFDDVLLEENGHQIRETRHWKLNDSHGGDPLEWTEDLRVREFPKS